MIGNTLKEYPEIGFDAWQFVGDVRGETNLAYYIVRRSIIFSPENRLAFFHYNQLISPAFAA